MIALVFYVLYSTFKPEPPTPYEMTKVSYGEITDCLDVNGTVESGVSENFTAIEGVVVEEVFVSVGDKVKNGDLLATFNVSNATKYLNDAKKDCDKALKDYTDAKTATDENAKRKAEIASEITKVKKEIEAKEKEISVLEQKVENEITVPEVEIPTDAVTFSQEQVDAVINQMTQNGATKEEIQAFIEAIEVPEVTVPEITVPEVTVPEVTTLSQEQINDAINQMKENGATTEDIKNYIESVTLPEITKPEIPEITQEQVNAVISQMTQNGATKDEIDAFIESISKMQPDIEIPSELPEASNEPTTHDLLIQKNLELAQLKSDLAALQSENAVTVSTDNETILENLKTIADAKKATYENVKNIYDKMKNGWYAENDGIVTVVNIKPGEAFVPVKDNKSSFDLSALIGDSVNFDLIASLMGDAAAIPTGIGVTLESYDDMIVSVTVSKSDLLKIKTGMKAIATSLDTEYDAEVVYVGATAVDNSGTLDISSITSSLMGGTSGASGAIVKVKINNPDEKVVIGFDIDIKIELETVEDVLKVPVESVIYNNGKYFVFVFDEDEGTAVKCEVVKGTLDDTSYEIVSGLKEGDFVLKSPDPNMEDGTKVQNKTA